LEMNPVFTTNTQANTLLAVGGFERP